MATEDDLVLKAISDKLDKITRFLAYLVAAKHNNLQDRASTLNRFGLTRTEIACICDTTPNTISVRLTESKKRPKSKRTNPPTKSVRKARKKKNEQEK
jgi:hypothetical protein